ncbi:MAG: hypothetical protein JW712_09030 [Dehalococcoidales bacterium]|nr:hypothetical protein [Dehalococcoidales bacterium]
MSEGFAEEKIEYFLSNHTDIVLTKTSSRSVLGSMNDFTFQIKYDSYDRGNLTDADLSEINRFLVQNPMSAIKYNICIRELEQRLADALG